MDWYWWIVIGVAVVVVGYFKLKIFKSIMGKKKAPLEEEEEE